MKMLDEVYQHTFPDVKNGVCGNHEKTIRTNYFTRKFTRK